AGALRTPQHDVIARTESEQRRGPVSEVGEHQFARRTIFHGNRCSGHRIDQLDMDESPAAEMHTILVLALSPERDGDVADSHRLGYLGAPGLFELRAHRRLATARLARDENPLNGTVLQ